MKKRAFVVLTLSVIVFGVGVVAISLIYRRAKAPVLFRQYVLDPIPESVAGIRAHQPKTLGGYGYTFRFEIDRSDLTLILDSRPLERVYSIRYVDQVLDWNWNPSSGVMMSPYGPGWWPREPKWFADLEAWTDVEAYALDQEQDDGRIIEVLIHDSDLEEAIFVTFYAR